MCSSAVLPCKAAWTVARLQHPSAACKRALQWGARAPPLLTRYVSRQATRSRKRTIYRKAFAEDALVVGERVAEERPCRQLQLALILIFRRLACASPLRDWHRRLRWRLGPWQATWSPLWSRSVLLVDRSCCRQQSCCKTTCTERGTSVLDLAQAITSKDDPRAGPGRHASGQTQTLGILTCAGGLLTRFSLSDHGTRTAAPCSLPKRRCPSASEASSSG